MRPCTNGISISRQTPDGLHSAIGNEASELPGGLKRACRNRDGPPETELAPVDSMTSVVIRSSTSGVGPFVGRDREMTVAGEMLADTERTRVALIGGESGLGKTRLVEEIIAQAPASTAVVRTGCVPRQTPIPFDMVRGVLGEATPSGDADGGQDGFDLSTPRDDECVADQIRAAAEALRSLSDGPSIYVFEDIHWADAESLEVIDRLVVAGPLTATLLVTYRPNALHSGLPASGFLQRVERRNQVVQLRLEPLRRHEVAEYLRSSGRDVDGKMVEHVHSRTGGNALLLCELVASTENDVDLADGLPWTLSEILRPEIEGLPQDQREVAQVIAVLGVEVGFDLVASAVEATENELLTRLRALVDSGILIERGPDRFGFRHELVREAVADGLFTRERRRIHAAVHDALLASGSDDAVALVAHASGAGRMKEAADAASEAAYEALARGRSHQAMAFAEQAMLVHTDDIGLIRVAVVAGWRGERERAALDHLDRWEELTGSSPIDKAEILHHRVRLLYDLDDEERSDLVAEELATVIEDIGPGLDRAKALANLAQHHMLRGRSPQAIVESDRALAVAADVGPDAAEVVLQARAERASARLLLEEDRSAAISELLQVAAEAEVAGDHVVASRALHNAPLQPPILDARAHIERMRRASQRAGITGIATDNYRLALLNVCEAEGDKDAYTPLLEAAIEDLADSHDVVLSVVFLALDNGDIDRARSFARKFPSGRPAHSMASSWQSTANALIDLDVGDAGAARTWLESEAPTFASMHIVIRFLSTMLRNGLAVQLRAFVERGNFEDRTKLLFDPVMVAVQAEITHSRDADSLYAQALDSGILRSVVTDSEIHLARARLALPSGGDPQVHLQASAQRLAHWPGARLDAVEQLMDGTTSEADQSVLTPREREIATLVSQGLTNGGIADELFISTKTASVHVSHILAKLNMSTRSEIAAWVASGSLG